MSEPVYGIVCEKCGGRLEIESTDRPCKGKVIRYRICKECRHRMKTVETVCQTYKRKVPTPRNTPET